ncbi:MAG: M20/M25/M40 family metallo-hydrolase [Verrucomicrobia bacterium]|nr:M20/M25/M40 family metallo-hydrolase [Verrucomicrobiota bacterium]
MRSVFRFAWLIPVLATLAHAQTEKVTVDRFFAEALAHGQAYENLRVLTTQHPGRLAGSQSLEGAVVWAQKTLGALPLDRVYTQDVMVPHWERGAPESVLLLDSAGHCQPLAAAALGNSGATPADGLTAEVVEVKSLAEVRALGRTRLAGKIVFFNRPMNPAVFRGMTAYGEAGDQRNQGPAAAAAGGAVAVLTRSLTHALDDVPHTGNTRFPPESAAIPAAALSTLAADRLAAALAADPHTRVHVAIHARKLPDAPSHNVIGEIRGSEFPDQIIVVGGHLDSWDITPGAHDDGAGVVQSIEVLRLFRALGLKPRHTLRCVLFTNEENGLRGAVRYAQLAREEPGRHIFAIESDNGGFAPNGFNFGSTQGDAHLRAARWRGLFEPWGLWNFSKGSGGADVGPLMLAGVTIAGLTPDSQRYFDYHHTAIDTIEKVNPRELHLGAAALAALVWLVDTQGL